jgi:ATP-dependent DNA helicase PIF1
MLDNRYVVPYNKYLLKTFNCHINVEICSSVHSVKYLYKYVYKGHDRIQAHVTTMAQTEEAGDNRSSPLRESQ